MVAKYLERIATMQQISQRGGILYSQELGHRQYKAARRGNDFCVEDDNNIRELVVYTLESTGFQATDLKMEFIP